jgi:hypothetical protein
MNMLGSAHPTQYFIFNYAHPLSLYILVQDVRLFTSIDRIISSLIDRKTFKNMVLIASSC